MVRQRIPLVVDNSNALDTQGSTVVVDFSPPIDLDLDRNYRLTISEVDVTYIQPNFVNGSVGFSYVYTTSGFSNGYVMRTIFDATYSAAYNIQYYNSNTMLNQSILQAFSLANCSYTDATTNVTDKDRTTSFTITNNSTVSTSNPTGINMHWLSALNTNVTLNNGNGDVPETITPPTSIKTLYFYYNVSQPCTITIYATDAGYNTSTATSTNTFNITTLSNILVLPITYSAGQHFLVTFSCTSSSTLTIYDAFFEILPNILQQTVQNTSYVGATAISSYYSTSANSITGIYSNAFTDAIADSYHQFTPTGTPVFTTANPFVLQLNYVVTLLPNALSTISNMSFYFDASLTGTSNIIKIYLCGDNTYNYLVTPSTLLTTQTYTGSKLINFSFPTPVVTNSTQNQTVSLYFTVLFQTPSLVSPTTLTVNNAFFILDQCIPNYDLPPTVRFNSSGSVVDKWTSFYNDATNTYGGAIVPITDTNGNPVVNRATTNRLMTVAQGLPTGLYDLDDLSSELLNILERDPAFVSYNKVYPPFKILGDYSTEQVQIQILDPNLYIELPVIGAYAQSNVLYWLGFDPVQYQDVSQTANLFTAQTAPTANFLTIWTSQPYQYTTSGTKSYSANPVTWNNGGQITPIYSDTSARLNQLTAYYLNSDISAGTYINGQASSVISTITPVNAQVGAIYSYRPFFPMRVRLTKKFLDQATFWITDQNGNRADFSNAGQNDVPESWSFRAFIEEMD